MANEITGKIPKKWETDMDQVKQFVFSMEGGGGYTHHYRFAGTGKYNPYLINGLYRYGDGICGAIRLPTSPCPAVEVLADELKQSKRNPPLPLPTMVLFYIISMAHYKMCCMELQVQCRKKKQHQTAIDYVCAESNEYNHIYNMLVNQKECVIEKWEKR
jgi:hypothetical protein